MRIPGLKILKQSARWLRSRFVNGALILGYHRVADVRHDPFAMCVSPQHFAEQLEVLRQYAHPISLEELIQGLRDGHLPQRTVVLTLDDGYVDALYQAKPRLEHYQIPATVFIATGYLGREFWWDELERMLSPAQLPEQLSLAIDGKTYEWILDDKDNCAPKIDAKGPKQHLLWSLYERLLALSPEARQTVMAQLWEWVGPASNGRQPDRALTPEEVTQLAAGRLVEIGAHTVTHPMLATLPAAAQQAEIQQSKTCLEEMLGRPVSSFSYPNGSATEYTWTLVREAGFSCACTSLNDVTWHGSDLFYLPRFWIPDWDGATFARWLQWWLRG